MLYLLDILEYCIRGTLLMYLCNGAIVIKNKYARQGKYIFFLLFVIWGLWLSNSEWLHKLLYGSEEEIQRSSTSIVKVILMMVFCFGLMEILYEGSRLLKLYLVLLFETVIELSRFGMHCFWTLGINVYINMLTERMLKGKIEIDTFNFWIKQVENIGLTLLILLYSAMSCLTIRAVCKYRKNMQDISRQGIMFLMISPAVGMAFGIILRCILYNQNGMQIDFLYDRYKGMYVIVPVMIFLCILSIVYSTKIYEELILAQEEKSSLLFYKQQLTDMTGHVQEMERLYDGIRSVRHDMNNYIADMEQLLSERMNHSSPDDITQEETRKYLYHMKDALDGMTIRYSTGNPVTDVITNRKYQECEKAGISFTSDFIYPEELGIEAFDLGILMNNALDNAIEACKKCEGKADVGIRIHSYIKGRMFFLSIENNCNGAAVIYTQGRELKTTKEDEWLHGIGLKNMKSVVEKYYGTMTHEIRDDVFYLTIMLQGRSEKL